MQPTKGAVPIRQAGGDLFDSIYDTIARRAFDLFLWNGGCHGRDWEDWFRAESEILHAVPLEVTETEDEFTVKAEVPGFTAKELDIKVEPFRLSMAGKRESKAEEKKGKTLHSEICSDQILRTIDFPVHVDTARTNAVLKDGILTIELPKAAHAKPVRIQPKAA
jgi:HSP20 family protein